MTRYTPRHGKARREIPDWAFVAAGTLATLVIFIILASIGGAR